MLLGEKMKRLISSLCLVTLLYNPLYACDWGSIQSQGSSYIYTADCHKEVGKLVNKVKELESANLERQKESERLYGAIKMKDLALDKADQRIMTWRNETYSQHERLLRHEKMSKYNDWAYFGGGVLITILSVWAAGQIKN